VLFDKIASVYFTLKNIYILALEIARPGNQHRASKYQHTFVPY